MPQPRIDVRPATLRDLCFTLANARQIDKDEIIASGPQTLSHAAYITDYLLREVGGFGYCVWIDDNPEYAFGFTRQSPLMPWLFSGWAWGSGKAALAMIGISRWARDGRLVGELDQWGVKRIEARSIINHHDAHRWLAWLGFSRETVLKEWGRDGADFIQFAWLRSEYGKMRKLIRRHEGGCGNVHGIEPTGSATASAKADD